jgi:hypothetical protein
MAKCSPQFFKAECRSRPRRSACVYFNAGAAAAAALRARRAFMTK